MGSTNHNDEAILIFDSQGTIHSSLCVQLHSHGFRRVFAINEPHRLKAFISEAAVRILIFGLYAPFEDAKNVIKEICAEHPEVSIIVTSVTGDQGIAVELMKTGVHDYVRQPFEADRLIASIHSAMEKSPSRLQQPIIKHPFQATDATRDTFAPIVTRNRKMQSIFRYIEAIAPTSQTVLITGETGTGKELAARAIHEISGKSGSFVSVNVAGLDDIMFSDTLFGHGRGAFTGADRDRKGLIEKAAGGTLFLDEIGDLSIASQVKLLRLLQEDEYYPLGSDNVSHSTARILVATNSSLEKTVADGGFRSDLYYRLCSHHIHLPALRERRDDIPLLVQHFSRQAAQELNRPQLNPSADTIDMLVKYDFPGNVRELRGLVNNAVAIATTDSLSFPRLQRKTPAATTGGVPSFDFTPLQRLHGRLPTLLEAEEYLIKEALRVSGGNQRAAAVMLGISRQALNKRLQRDPGYLDYSTERSG